MQNQLILLPLLVSLAFFPYRKIISSIYCPNYVPAQGHDQDMHFNSTEHTWLLIYVDLGMLHYGSTVIKITELK